MALGLHAEARKRLEAANAAHPDDLPLRDALMRLYETVGERDALAPLVDVSYADWNAGAVARTKPADLLAIATAARLDRNWKDANDVLRDAVRADPRGTAANLDWGGVLLEKHNGADAAAAFKDVIKLDPENPDAHAGLARVAIVDRYDGAAALEEIARVLAVNPAHAEALALRAQLALDSEDWAAAKADVAALRRTNPRDAGAARIAATAALLLDDRAGYEAARDAALAVRPRDGAFFAFVAEALTRHRRYDEARAVAAEGVAADADDAACLSVLAMTLLRLGDETAGLDTLRRAWKSDPYDVRTFNLLNLFEKAIPARYTTISSAHLPLPHSARRAQGDHRGGRAVPRGALRALRRPLWLRAGGADHVRALRRTARVRGAHRRPAGDRSGRRLLRQGDHVADADQPRVQLGDGAGARARARVRDPAVARARAALADRGAVRGRDHARPPGMVAPRRRLDLPRLPPRRPAVAAVTVERVHHRAHLGGRGAHVRAFGACRRFSRTAVRLRGDPRRPGGVRPRRARGRGVAADGRHVRRCAGQGIPRRAGAAIRALRQAIFRNARSPASPPGPAGKAGKPAGKPTTAGEWAATGLGALRAGDLEGARKALDKARAVPQPPPEDQADTLFLAGEIALARRDADAAVAAFEGLLDVPTPAHDGYDVRVRLGLAEVRRKRLPAAEAHLRRAVDFDPTRVEPHVLLAELYKDQQRAADRLGALAAALRLEPQNDDVAKQVVLGDAAAGRSARVAELAPIAIFIDPADPDLHAALGRALAATGKTAAGAAALERALVFGVKQPALLHLELAALYDRLGDRGKAAAHRAAGAAPRRTAIGERQRERRAASRRARHLDPAAVVDDDLVHQRQPQTGPRAPSSRRTGRRSC